MVLQMAPAKASVWGYAPSSAIGQTVVVSLTSSINVHSYTAAVVPGNQSYTHCFSLLKSNKSFTDLVVVSTLSLLLFYYLLTWRLRKPDSHGSVCYSSPCT